MHVCVCAMRNHQTLANGAAGTTGGCGFLARCLIKRGATGTQDQGYLVHDCNVPKLYFYVCFNTLEQEFSVKQKACWVSVICNNMGMHAALVLCMGTLAVVHARPTTVGSKPSFLFILADDIGWSDFGYNNGTAHTPFIDTWTKQPGTVVMQDFHSGGTVSWCP